MKDIIVWYNPNKKTYYYKIVSGFYRDYKVGLKNNYGHEIVIIIKGVYTLKPRLSLKTKIINKLIRFLEKIKWEDWIKWEKKNWILYIKRF